MSTTFELKGPGGLSAGTRKVAAVARLYLWEQWAYPLQLVSESIFAFVVMFTFASLWKIVSEYHDVAALTGMTMARLIWYLGFSEALAMSFGVPWTGLPSDLEIRSGDIAYRLTRPQSYVLYHWGACLGQRMARFGFRAPLHALFAWGLVGWPGLSPVGVGAALIAAVGACFADLACVLAISFTSFWVEDTFGLHFVYRRSMFILGGLMFPLEAYPRWLRNIAEAFPFRAILYGPARLFVRGSAEGLGHLLFLQLSITTVGCAVMMLLYRLGVRRLNAQGG